MFYGDTSVKSKVFITLVKSSHIMSPLWQAPPQLVSVFLTIIFADEDRVDQYLIESGNESQCSFSAPLPAYKKKAQHSCHRAFHEKAHVYQSHKK